MYMHVLTSRTACIHIVLTHRNNKAMQEKTRQQTNIYTHAHTHTYTYETHTHIRNTHAKTNKTNKHTNTHMYRVHTSPESLRKKKRTPQEQRNSSVLEEQTLESELDTASRTRCKLRIVCLLCAVTTHEPAVRSPRGTSCMLDGSKPIWPAKNTTPSTVLAWEYGPMQAGAHSDMLCT
jgi:hypothetical protein